MQVPSKLDIMAVLNGPLKFFPNDIVTGNADKPGDTFTAMFCGTETEYRVANEHFSPSCFYGERV